MKAVQVATPRIMLSGNTKVETDDDPQTVRAILQFSPQLISLESLGWVRKSNIITKLSTHINKFQTRQKRK
jgi:hypothetical protein